MEIKNQQKNGTEKPVTLPPCVSFIRPHGRRTALDLRREACDVAALRRKKDSTLTMMTGEEVPHFYISKLPIVRLSGCYVI